MRAHVKDEMSVDNRALVRVIWERETPDANAPTLEAVFQYNPAESFSLTESKPGVLVLLSVTRTDTRKAVEFWDDEEAEIYQMASEYVMEKMT